MKPILFNAQMVRAILDGRKTQTRRVVKFPEGMTGQLPPGGANDYLYYPGGIKWPMYHKGDMLWVRETWSEPKYPDGSRRYVYKASDEYPFGEDGYIVKFRWHPSIHMPREAARIFLRVTDVRVERLQHITRDGAISEGCNAAIPILEFQGVWDTTIKPADRDRYGWDANPWVWVYTFKRCGKEGESWNG